MLEAHVEAMRARGHRVHQVPAHVEAAREGKGTFLPPTLIEIERLEQLEREVFGPVLHVLRYRRDDLEALVEGINRLGFGLTLGIHSRVDETIAAVTRHARVGNAYVNRNMIGAVVGVQPFGGEGLSGTGPKAGGPLYVHRFLARTPDDAALRELQALDPNAQPYRDAALQAFAAWCSEAGFHEMEALCARLLEISPAHVEVVLPGPTGERNTYSVLARESVLCIAEEANALLAQTAAVLAVGGRAVWEDTAESRLLHARLPELAAGRVVLADWRAPGPAFDAVLHTGSAAQRREICMAMASRPGPIVGVHAFDARAGALHLERLLIERVASVNTAAAGGNATLMTVG
jgi:RHH-type proline utilization regulon transcriptional repressor/proline dehydrogenase/delta 1-pyrroline-5-carboxylate dehydrogenase